MKKADYIKLLLAIAENTRFIGQDFIDNATKRGDKSFGRQRLVEADALTDAARILQKPDYAEALWKIYFRDTDAEKEAI